MKELSIEQKAKRYDEALIRGSRLWESDMITRENYEYIFPELKESDDEKIRKALVEMVHDTTGDSLWIDYNVHKEDALAWLEKQGEQNLANSAKTCKDEQKSIWHNEDEEPKRGSLILLIMQSGTPIVAKIIEPNHTFNHGERWAYIDDLLEKQGEQKSAEWSEEDEAVLDALIRRLEGENVYVSPHLAAEHLKSIKGRVQPKQEWSEEDQKIWEEISDTLWEGYKQSCSKFSWDDIRNWLKPKIDFFKDRVQPQPKQEWSEEDEETLKDIITSMTNLKDSATSDALRDIYNSKIAWLKSLRPHNQWKPREEDILLLERMANGKSNPQDFQASLGVLIWRLKKLRE